ncbi:tRNA (adenosine(37)-N6)-threonylcarbamoyltransferase complex dimerization subunit type 1 TsaB [Shewanella sp. Scap07]|uniref:tRNA (adenosine(37)-N6)-threonylcarbamoyltransferase complex dimerization subunit type 1 TsaB n=1 Tax=Shewanella sp. Scap07 TaxID=2589987 RepID=UPI0015C08AD6|nr:tRNA (adenosine(37)-N6)-threonylcarbamoyltransferase complex dimerization subunit type 1 TsaB [Shewanella sp. Scap07]QLE85787.1 tRNA (adenosine(37)-N6)-threonylcarbamoyltransferase complex dimerization subunit type 1 TsaB [Shewanella sp. Scap07]
MLEDLLADATHCILALDTCTESCSVALYYQGKVFAEQADAPREHSQRLLPMVNNVLSQASITLAEVDFIAYGRGPGSFTGIRICTSMTQGLALGQDIEVVGISTLQAMAQAAISEEGAQHVLTAIDARMGEVYWAEFTNVEGRAERVGEEHVCLPEAVSYQVDTDSQVVLCGTGFEAYPQLAALFSAATISEIAKFPEAKFMLPLAEQAHKQGLATDVDGLAPVYLRDTVTWKKLPGRE